MMRKRLVIPRIFDSLNHELLFSSFGYLRPCTDSLVTWTLNSSLFVDDSGRTVLRDMNASGSHEAIPGQHITIAPGQTITGLNATASITSHGGTATVALAGGTISCSVGGTLFDIVLDNGTTYSCGEGGSEISLIPDQVGDPVGTLVGFTLPTDRPESATTGHSWNVAPGYSKNVYSSELSPDVPFDQPSFWTVFNGASVTGGQALIPSASSYILPASNVNGGPGTYEVTVDIDSNTNDFRVYLSTYADGAQFSGTGVQTKSFTTADTSNKFIVLSLTGGVVINSLNIKKLYPGYIPADPANNWLDVFGNQLTNPGSARQNIAVKGYAGTFDGTAYGLTEVTGVGDGPHEIKAFIDNITDTSPSGRAVAGTTTGTGGVLFQLDSAGKAKAHCYVDGSLKSALGTTDLRDGNPHTISQVVTSSAIEVWVDGVMEGSTPHSNVFSTSGVALRIGSCLGASALIGALPKIELYDSASTLTNKWVAQSANDLNQSMIWDVGGNHATLTGATLPFFTTKIDNSYLAQYGGRVVENLLKYSNDLTVAATWPVTTTTVTGNKTDGYEVTGSAVNAMVRQISPEPYLTGQQATYTFWAKRGTSSYLRVDSLGSGGGLDQTHTDYTNLPTEYTKYTITTPVATADGDTWRVRFYPAYSDPSGNGEGSVFIKDVQITFDSSAQYIETSASAIQKSIVPYGALNEANTFNGTYDAPENTLILNAVESLEIFNADLTNILLDAAGSANDVDPYDLADIPDHQFITDRHFLLYSEDIIPPCLEATNRYLGK